MFKLHEIREMIKLIDQSSIQEFKLEWEGSKLSIKKNLAPVVETSVPAPASAAQPAPVQVQPTTVVASPVPDVQPAPVAQEQSAQAKAAETAPADDANLHKITAPMVGTFYRSPEPGKPSYVEPGDKVTANKVVCILEAMKLFNEIEAEVTGEIVKVLVEDGQLVEYGQPLFLVKPE
ncbi:acetyl-CoA carboxylase biotin carboxyl carrier protein [Brevibacillus humidisoli]|uniref:acetyl-CoA carboxylase biotin carboxyl carrier protein n=1 Tax=Brevibacillus humidisoli TaxID=2895522 RepID=UPI001E41D50D|nr:acetyl-CoA carboxylase biotin carboxyl carrier protein [Brevibacillus humidisoli]UFJ42915.1 acetyl-CoA carboxylase biotin carboxyl carrier protein [Brevibacillus humidisoli]